MMRFPELTPEENAEIERDAEYLDAFGEYTDQMVTGREPNIDVFVLQYPQFEERLREDLEFAQCFYDAVQEFKRQNPHIDIADLLFPDADSQARQAIDRMRGKRRC
jgi:hypothetical protein